MRLADARTTIKSKYPEAVILRVGEKFQVHDQPQCWRGGVGPGSGFVNTPLGPKKGTLGAALRAAAKQIAATAK